MLEQWDRIWWVSPVFGYIWARQKFTLLSIISTYVLAILPVFRSMTVRWCRSPLIRRGYSIHVVSQIGLPWMYAIYFLVTFLWENWVFNILCMRGFLAKIMTPLVLLSSRWTTQISPKISFNISLRFVLVWSYPSGTESSPSGLLMTIISSFSNMI